MTTIHDRLKQVRDREGLSTQELADAVGRVGHSTTKQTVGNYEDGTTEKIPTGYVAALAQLYDVNPAWVVLGDDYPMLLSEDADGMRLQIIAAIAGKKVPVDELKALRGVVTP